MGRLTFLRSLGGGNLTKSYSRLPDGSMHKKSAPKVQEFFTEFVDYHDAESLFNAIDAKAKDPSCCLIRGKRAKYCRTDPGPIYRRASSYFGYARHDGKMQPEKHWPASDTDKGKVYWLQTFSDQLTDWVALDMDGGNWKGGSDDWVEDLAHTAEVVRDSVLPPWLHGVSCWVQATGSAIDPSKPEGPERNALRLRFVFKLTRGQTAGQLRQLFKGVPNLDRCTLSVHQPIYVASPVFGPGCYDHLEERSAIAWGERDEADPPLVPAEIIPDHVIGGDGIEEAEEGTGLVPDEGFEEALERIDGTGGGVRSKLINAAARYAERHGAVDIGAMVNRLTAVALRHRDKREVEGYGVTKLVKWGVAQGQAKRNEQRDTGDAYDPFGGPAEAGSCTTCTTTRPEPAEPEAKPSGGFQSDPPEPDPEPEPTVEASPEDASKRLFEALDGAISKALAFRQEHIEKSGYANTVIKVTAGTGKTSVALDILATRAKGVTGHYYAPTHALAEEVAEKARDRGIDAVVIKGRSRPIGDDEFMCKKHKLAEKVAQAGMKVWPSLCEQEDRGHKYDLPPKCEFFDTCGYINQFKEENVEGRLLVMPHDWLRLDKSRMGTAQFSIIDEAFYTSLLRGGNFCLDRITRIIDPFILASVLTARKKAKKRKGDDDEGPEFKPNLEEHAATARKVRAAIEAGEPVGAHGVTLEELERAQKTEALFVPDVWIAPAMPRYQQQALAEEVAKGAEARKLSWLYETLIETYEWDRLTQQVHLVRDCIRWKGDEMADRVFIRSKSVAKLSKHAAAVVIDASANLDILKSLMIVTDYHEINAPIQARVIQVTDTECSRGKLLKRGASSKKTIARIMAFAKKKAAEGNRVLVVCYKDAVDALAYVEGVDTLHFGKLRGVDSFKGHDVVIIAGRHQTDAKNVENQARAIFGGGRANNLDLPGNYVEARIPYKTRSPVAQIPARVHVHPDSRVQALVEQGREEETMQAVARLRLVHRDKPATVYLLSSMPTSLVVDEFVGWNALLPDKVDEAAAESGGVELLTASELARCHPEKWPSTGAAKQFLRRRKLGTNLYRDSNREMSPVSPWLVTYRTVAGGTRGPAPRALIPADLTFSEGIDALVKVVGPLTSFIEDPRHHEPEEDDAAEPTPPRRAAVF